jgi:hypothetical protein
MSKSNNVYNVAIYPLFTSVYGVHRNYNVENIHVFSLTRINNSVILNFPEVGQTQVYRFANLITLDYIS